MKLVLFTPATAASAIAGIVALLERELLNRGHEVAIVRTEDSTHVDDFPYPFEADIVRWDDMKRVTKLTQEADVIVYQIGNNYPFHRGCLEWLPRAPGVVCLHDYFVAHMFWAWAEHNRPQAEAILQSWYGDDVARDFFKAGNTWEFVDNVHDIAPMTEWIASMATGLITHSNWDIKRILSACSGPVRVVALPERVRDLATTTFSQVGTTLATSNVGAAAAEFTVLTVGHMNSNKRQKSVIQALGKSSLLREKTEYRLVGPIEAQYSQELSALARRLGVRLSISGAVDDPTLAQEIERASVLCCLRFPVLESASASAVEAMLGGKATVVTDTGFYKELPDDCVCKISPDPGHEVDDLQHVLESLYEHGDKRRALGSKAMMWARETFSAAKYAEQLIQVCELAIKAAPGIAAGRYFAETLRRWGASEALLGSPEVFSYLTPLGML